MPAICDNMNELGGDYIKWNKLDVERQKFFIIIQNPKKKSNVELIEYNVNYQKLKDEVEADWSQSTNFQLYLRRANSGNLTYYGDYS